jgi:hypothetical protein
LFGLEVSDDVKFTGDSKQLLRVIKTQQDLHIWHRAFLMDIARLDIEISSPVQKIDQQDHMLR